VSPRSRVDIVRPRLQSARVPRPLNFTVRRHMATPRENVRIIITSLGSMSLTLAGFYCGFKAFSADAPIRLVIATVVFWALGMWVARYLYRLFISTHPRATAVTSNNRWRVP